MSPRSSGNLGRTLPPLLPLLTLALTLTWLTPTASGAEGINVTYFHVKSSVYNHFATVTLDGEVTNSDDQAREVVLQVGVAEDGFMKSTFSVFVDRDDLMGQALGDDAATNWYETARARNQTAGRMQRVPRSIRRGMELYKISLTLAPAGNASFTLVYHQELERQSGQYTQLLVLQPGFLVKDFEVSATYNEPQGFTSFTFILPGTNASLSASSPGDQVELKAPNPRTRELVYRPTVEMQQQFPNETGVTGVQSVLTISYTLNTEPGGGAITTQGDSFVHYFARDDLPALPKNILFIIDVSGSMSGEKIQQVDEAMTQILDQLQGTQDTFNIMLFSSSTRKWLTSPAGTSASEIEQAKTFLQTYLIADGGTNIYRALTSGLTTVLGGSLAWSCERINMIVFLTDGQPSTGITSTTQITEDVTAQNRGRALIFTLGFGLNADFDFLRILASRNGGTAVIRIDTNWNAAKELEKFYNYVKTPVLCGVWIIYGPLVVDLSYLTRRNFPIYFLGQEIVVAGRTKRSTAPTDSSQWEASVTGTGLNGNVSLEVPQGQVRRASTEDVELELTWAYMKIKSLLRELDVLESEADKARVIKEARDLSLSYDFFTPLTNVSTVVDDVQEKRRRRRQQGVNKAWTATGSGTLVCSLVLALLMPLRVLV